MTKLVWISRVARRVAQRIGRRGASLLFVALLAFVLATSLLFVPPEQSVSPGYLVLATFAPLMVWSAAWALVGATCLVQAFMRTDRIAFAVSTAMWWLYGIAYIVGVWTGANPRGWVAGLIWIFFGAWLNLIATWQETRDLRQMPGGASPGGAVVTADGAGVIRSFNAEAVALFGWSAKEVVGKPLTVLMPQAFHAAHAAGVRRVRDTGQSKLSGQVIAVTALHRDGSEFPAQLTVNAWEGPDGLTLTGVIRPDPKGA